MDSDSERLGRYGAIWCKDTLLYTPPTGTFFCAISFPEAAVFATLALYNHALAGASSTLTGLTFPAGSTIRGMWTAFQLTSGSLIAYKVASKAYAYG